MGIQVEELTKDLMPWEKEYIDFSFNGHHISEYGLVAASSSDRYSFGGSPEFEDETSTINGVMGQYYWGTKIKTKKYEYNLATDGMTEEQFTDFKRLFRPGLYGQFYEDTWWDRYCYVRIESVVDFTFVPFQVEDTIAGVPIKTRIYKGECKLTLIQDKPFQFAYQHVLDSTIADLQATKNPNQQAAIRMMYHSNIPAKDSWTKNVRCCIGANTVLGAAQPTRQIMHFIAQPVDIIAEKDQEAQFTVKAVGMNLSYQWQFSPEGKNWDNTAIVGYDTDTLMVQALTYRNNYSYRCLITDGQGNRMYSNSAQLKIGTPEPITLIARPADTSIIEDETALFAVKAQGASLTYQWQFTTDWKNWDNTANSGYNTDTLTVQALAYRNNYGYRCLITDAQGNNITSYAAKLTIIPKSANSQIIFSGHTIPYYNPSTYDCESVIKFDLTHSTTAIDIESDGLWHPVYFNEINDEYNVEDDLDQVPYNVIGTSFPLAVGAAEDSEGQQLSRTFKYSLPETFEQINKAIKIAYDYWQLEEEGAAVSLEERLREELVNGKVLSWAISAIQIVMSYDGVQNNPQLYIPDDGEDKEGIGTFTANTIDIYCGPVNGNERVSANWFGFFNIIMLCMFAEFKDKQTINYDFTKSTLLSTSFYDYTLTIDSELGICKVDYTYNSDLLNGRQILTQTGENCSNIALSEYLLLDGGDKLNKTTGKINTYHQLIFRRGNTPMSVKNAELKYKYTYM